MQYKNFFSNTIVFVPNVMHSLKVKVISSVVANYHHILAYQYFSHWMRVTRYYIIRTNWTASSEFGTYRLCEKRSSGEPAHPRSLTRTFAARSYKQ